MGAVIWRVHWGLDACFESHATQPRATLIDNCTGGFMQSRQGGDYNQLPNHLDDLTIWNMYSERSRTEAVIRLLPVYSTGGVSALKVGSFFRPLLSVFMANR